MILRLFVAICINATAYMALVAGLGSGRRSTAALVVHVPEDSAWLAVDDWTLA